MELKNSKKLYEDAVTMFPGGVHSPVRAFKSVGTTPLFIKKGKGSWLWDVDDNKYLDFCGSWGPLILGHADDDILEYLSEVMKNGLSFGAPSELGNKLGHIILDNNRFIEKIRFVSSGTEAVMSALRLARGFTGKSRIIKFEGCYHGHVDSVLVKAGSGLSTLGVSSSAGVLADVAEKTIVLPLGDLSMVEDTMKNSDDIAALIIEPIPANNGLLLQTKDYLLGLRDLCTKYGVLLIFDEVISGFRVGFEGASGYYGIQPDIITYGKIIGGGMPVGAYGASSEIMSYISPDGPVYQAGTLSANPMAMAAGYMTLKRLLTTEFYDNLERKKCHLIDIISENINSEKIKIQHIGSIFWISFSGEKIYRADQIKPQNVELFPRFHKGLLENSIYLGPSAYEVAFISSKHTLDELEEAALNMAKVLNFIT